MTNKRMVYIGRRLNAKNQMRYHYLDIRDDNTLDDHIPQISSYTKPLYPGCTAGTIITIDIEPTEGGGSTAHLNTAKIVDRYQGPELTTWQAEDQTAGIRQRELKQEKALAKESRLAEILDELHDTYIRLSPASRPAFLALINKKVISR